MYVKLAEEEDRYDVLTQEENDDIERCFVPEINQEKDNVVVLEEVAAKAD